MKFLLNGHVTKRIKFRLLTEVDAEPWLSFCKDPLSTKYWEFKEVETAEERCMKFFQSTFDDTQPGVTE